MNHHSQHHAPGAFTLIELLVVISIVMLLIAILIPSLSKARETARTVVCASNQRQIGIGLATYAADYRGSVPRYPGVSLTSIDSTREWYLFYRGYLHPDRAFPTIQEERRVWELGKVVKVFDCPSTSARIKYGGYSSTHPKTFDYRRLAHYQQYQLNSTNPATANTPEAVVLADHDPRAIMIADSVSSKVDTAQGSLATGLEHPNYDIYPGVRLAWFQVNTSSVPGYEMDDGLRTWASTILGTGSENHAAGIHHNHGANILTADGAATWQPVSVYLPNFEHPLSLPDLSRLPAYRRLPR